MKKRKNNTQFRGKIDNTGGFSQCVYVYVYVAYDFETHILTRPFIIIRRLLVQMPLYDGRSSFVKTL